MNFWSLDGREIYCGFDHDHGRLVTFSFQKTFCTSLYSTNSFLFEVHFQNLEPFLKIRITNATGITRRISPNKKKTVFSKHGLRNYEMYKI